MIISLEHFVLESNVPLSINQMKCGFVLTIIKDFIYLFIYNYSEMEICSDSCIVNMTFVFSSYIKTYLGTLDTA